MDTTAKPKPKTVAEMLLGFDGPCFMRDIKSTAKKKLRPTINNELNTRTTEKYKPLTMAQMVKNFPAFESKSPRKNVQTSSFSNKKWNSSTKMVNKTVSHTSNNETKHLYVRKVLNFQPSKPKVVKPNSRTTMMNTETPKFPKPELRAKKPLYQHTRNNVRISGICNIPETPVTINKTVKNRMTIANKENINRPSVSHRKLVSTPKSTLCKKVLLSMIPDTSFSNHSAKSSGDDSFLQNEQDIENKVKALNKVKTLETAEVIPSVSTPFTLYRKVGDNLNNTDNHMENTYHDNTIMSLDNTVSRDNSKREESIILTLCEMLNKATVTSDKQSIELEDLMEAQKQIENNVEIVEKGIRSLQDVKEANLKSLAQIKKLIQNKTDTQTLNLEKKMPNESTPKNENQVSTKQHSVKNVNPKQLAYKIPKKTPCSKKKVRYENQSLSNLSRPMAPLKPLGDKALSMYLQMKEKNNYLATPLVKGQPSMLPNTPALTSHNLQQQLDRLYNEPDSGL